MRFSYALSWVLGGIVALWILAALTAGLQIDGLARRVTFIDALSGAVRNDYQVFAKTVFTKSVMPPLIYSTEERFVWVDVETPASAFCLVHIDIPRYSQTAFHDRRTFESLRRKEWFTQEAERVLANELIRIWNLDSPEKAGLYSAERIWLELIGLYNSKPITEMEMLEAIKEAAISKTT